jgi:hypothetical protein
LLTRLIIAAALILITVIVTLCVLFADVILAALWWVALIGGVFLMAAGLITLAGGVFRALGAFEEWQEKRATRQQKSLLIVQDGIGQSFLIRAKDDIVALTTNPGFFINGKATEPTQAELMMQALFFQAIGKGHVNSAQPNSPLILSAPESVPDLLPILDKAQRVLIRAISGDGKTTLLQHIADRRQGSVIVLDSQSYPGKWPTKCKVIGTGSDHAAISVTLDNLIELMVKRYKEIGEGLVREGEHPRLTVIIDEWMAIVSECANSSDVIRRLLTESRKAAFSVFIASHSERIKSLGLDGRGDLRDGFLIVRIESENGQYMASYDYGRGERPCQLPGEYRPSQQEQVFEIEAIAEPVASDGDKKDAEFIALVRRGMTRTEASRRVFNRKYAGSIVEHCKRLLEE